MRIENKEAEFLKLKPNSPMWSQSLLNNKKHPLVFWTSQQATKVFT